MRTKLFTLVILSFFILCFANVINTQDKNSAQIMEEYRETISGELQVLYLDAKNHSRKPVSRGGGGNSFNNWSIPDSLVETEFAFYQFELPAPDTLIITGIGKITGEDNVNPVRVELKGSPRDNDVSVIN